MSGHRTGRRLLLGIDVGTTTVKAGLFDIRGQMVAESAQPYQTHRPAPGWVEQDPEAWWRSIEAVVDQVMAGVEVASVAAIGLCSQVNTHVFVDKHLHVQRPAIVWQDQRAAKMAADLDDVIDEPTRQRIGGSQVRVDASSPLARIAWCARESPQMLDECRWVLSPKDFCTARLTGVVATDAMTAIGLVDQAGQYVPEVLASVPSASALLPPLAPMTSLLGPSILGLGPLPEGIPVVVGTMDAWAARYGSGAVAAGQGMEVAGTSEVVGLVSDRCAPTPGVVSFPPIEGRWFHAGPTQAGGDALRWWAHQRAVGVDDILADAHRAPIGAGGLVFLPHLMGERAPIWDPVARGAFVGLSTDHTRSDLARAVLEGVAFSVLHLLDALEQAADRPCVVLRASGGGAQSEFWCQMKANVAGRPVERLARRATGVLGAALLAGVGVGVLSDLDSAATFAVVDRRFEPAPMEHDRYVELYRCYRTLQDDLGPTYQMLARFRDRLPT